ncbi:unnamed protein product [Mytilus coruscus]|uniref:Uncharacterized protein n=1 Tax=Mytilus coruscus TaxID=42192 RepID=A0A6J8DR89_MYTCO|nr:unnamed protein product [Mytilus coruscus]
MMSKVTSLVQEQSAKQGTSPSSRSPNQDRSYNYSPRRNYGRGRGRGITLATGDIPDMQGHYVKDCPDLYVQDTGSRQSVQKEPTSQQVSFTENKEPEREVTGISTVRSLGAARLFRIEVDIAGKKVPIHHLMRNQVTEGSTQRFSVTQLSRQSDDIHFETVIPQVESNLGMMASTSTQESDEREIQEKHDQCRDSRDQCCIKKVESRENLGFCTCPKSGKREKHCFEEHLSEIFQTYHSTRLMEDMQ